MVKVVLRKPYSLINSEFNDFLLLPSAMRETA